MRLKWVTREPFVLILQETSSAPKVTWPVRSEATYEGDFEGFIPDLSFRFLPESLLQFVCFASLRPHHVTFGADEYPICFNQLFRSQSYFVRSRQTKRVSLHFKWTAAYSCLTIHVERKQPKHCTRFFRRYTLNPSLFSTNCMIYDNQSYCRFSSER
jgi:hypothetical protein